MPFGPHGEGDEPKPMTNGREQSDPAIVAAKSPNKSAKADAEAREPRAGAKENADEQNTHRTLCRERVTHALARVRERARQKKKEKFTALLHHINSASLRLAFYALKRDAAPGADGMTWEEYEQNLDARIEDLHGRIHRGAYRPQPARRTYIPKADGSQRPLAIAALEDKIVQGATVLALNAIYEEDFLGFSYGFRPKRSAHDAMDALVTGITCRRVNFILDADIRSFFDSVSQDWLIRFLEHRIGDKRVNRLIRKWLKAGVIEDGIVSVSDRGTGQGSAISPLLANIYLHYAFDLWAERYRRREAQGDMIIVRYADDVIVGFQHEEEAVRFLDALEARFAEFTLALHPEKTRLIEFGRFAAEKRKKRGLGKPETFNFLGFTFICGKSRDGRFLVNRKTRRDRMKAKLKEIKKELRRCMHADIADQGRWLGQVVRGFFNYHAVPTNSRSIAAFRHYVLDIWRRTLRRRSQKDGTTWDRMTKLQDQWLPEPRILHPWPSQRFIAKHPRWEPYAGKPHVRLCAGGA
jgi:group II intron reverse transcriptase/maturase